MFNLKAYCILNYMKLLIVETISGEGFFLSLCNAQKNVISGVEFTEVSMINRKPCLPLFFRHCRIEAEHFKIEASAINGLIISAK